MTICFNEIANRVVRVMKEFYLYHENDRILRLLFAKTDVVVCSFCFLLSFFFLVIHFDVMQLKHGLIFY